MTPGRAFPEGPVPGQAAAGACSSRSSAGSNGARQPDGPAMGGVTNAEASLRASGRGRRPCSAARWPLASSPCGVGAPCSPRRSGSPGGRGAACPAGGAPSPGRPACKQRRRGNGSAGGGGGGGTGEHAQFSRRRQAEQQQQQRRPAGMEPPPGTPAEAQPEAEEAAAQPAKAVPAPAAAARGKTRGSGGRRGGAKAQPRLRRTVTVDSSKARTSLEALKRSLRQLRWRESPSPTPRTILDPNPCSATTSELGFEGNWGFL
uniref:Uncharacterized protein n=1 Tax=Sphaerodactylus townsendi TaxID=933632 RepID=A0ACB8EZP5_9SAUR